MTMPFVSKARVEAFKKEQAEAKEAQKKAENLKAKVVVASTLEGTETAGYSPAKSRGLRQRELKSRRRELRITPSADEVIVCAMEVSGLTAGDLAYEGARKLLELHYIKQQRERDRKKRTSRTRR
jgi:hypothetical protein